LNHKQNTGVIGAVLALLTMVVGAESSVWKVTDGEGVLYIGGTIHLLTAEDYPLPVEFDQAYAASDHVVLETDITQLNQPEFQVKLLSELMYTGDSDLSSQINPQTEQALTEFALSRNIPIEMLMRFKPGMLSMSLTIMEMQRLGLAGTGVDTHFSVLATSDQKPLGQLETVEQQISFIANMGQDQVDKFVMYTLRQIDQLPILLSSMKVAWRSGDMDTIDDIITAEMKSDFPEVYNKLIVHRNASWMPQIEAMLDSEEVEFVLVGAGHLTGDSGLLHQLSEKGYGIDQLNN